MKRAIRRIIFFLDEHTRETELWMLPYSTLMLVLVILFIMFYSFSSSNSVEYEAALSDTASADPGDSRALQIKEEIELARSTRDYLKKNDMSDKTQLTITAHYIKIRMESLSLFDSGSAELKKQSLGFLGYLADRLRTMSNRIIVEGHTDNLPISNQYFHSNWELSAARAFSVIYYFINRGLAPQRLIAHGMGEFRPAFSNETEAGRAKNRRIEITIVRGAAKT